MTDIFDAKLLPCPFCAGVAEWEYTPWNEETETGDDGTGWVECQSCHVQMTGYDRDDAEARWNKRHNAIAHRPVEAEGRNGSGGATGSAALETEDKR